MFNYLISFLMTGTTRWQSGLEVGWNPAYMFIIHLLLDWVSFSSQGIPSQYKVLDVNRLNRKVEYALMALKVMAAKRAGELTSTKEIVDQTGCPFDPTARVLQQMTARGILRSEQGALGGYVLVRDLARVSFYEMNEIILGPVGLAKCLTGEDGCDLRLTCNIMSPVNVLNRKLTEFYQSLSVGELLRVKERSLQEVAP